MLSFKSIGSMGIILCKHNWSLFCEEIASFQIKVGLFSILFKMGKTNAVVIIIEVILLKFTHF